MDFYFQIFLNLFGNLQETVTVQLRGVTGRKFVAPSFIEGGVRPE